MTRTFRDPATFPVSEELLAFVGAIRNAGGRGILVGGFVRDSLLGSTTKTKDLDIEVSGLGMDDLEAVLARFGEVIAIGKTFGVLRVKGHEIDFSVPRRDNKVGRGHTGFRIEFDPEMPFEEAARRRDLTINSIGFDPLERELLDPFDGVGDLRRGVLRATDPRTFAEDSLRALRVAQFSARLEMPPDDELRALCESLDLGELSGERLFEELNKLLVKAPRPSIGFEFLRETALLRFFPELQALVGVPQDPVWHPEGTVWEHTLMVVDEAARMRVGERDDDLVLMYGALCHDLGKPATTFEDEDGRIRSPNHEPEGVEPSTTFLRRLRAPNTLIDRIGVLVRYHLAPAHFSAQKASPRAYRRLARRFGAVGLPLTMLELVARADHFGRTTPDALARSFPAGEAFLAAARELEVEERAMPDVVLGRHLIARGWTPGPIFGKILDRCREVQDEAGWTEAEPILERVFAERSFSTEEEGSSDD